MTIKPIVFGILVLAIFEGVILGFQKAGFWSVSGKVTLDGQAIQPSAEDVDSIKGWMTLEQVSKAFDVPVSEILISFSLPVDTLASAALKDLESETFSVEGLREWLLTRAQSGELEQVAEPGQELISTPLATPEETASTTVPTEHLAPDRTITGKTTFQELLDWGVEVETIQQGIGGDLPPLSTIIKDYITQQGSSFSEVKAALQEEVDKVR
jgi:hypothetical protein